MADVKVSEMQELTNPGTLDDKFVYVVTEDSINGNTYNKMSLGTLQREISDSYFNANTPHPCFTYDNNRFITGVNDIPQPNLTNGLTSLVDEYALGVASNGYSPQTRLVNLSLPNALYINANAFQLPETT